MISHPLLPTLTSEAQKLAPQLVAWRRDFHRHPELSFQEVRTAGIVADHLRSLGLEVSTGVGQTGVVALVEPDDLPLDAPTVLLRCDMDALPILEQTGLAFASQTPGVMHACGHDGHTAMGMGAATLLARHRNQLQGRVKLLFQPAEEIAAGARAMIADGVLADPVPQAAFGLHLWSTLPLNQVVVQPGPLWASAGAFTLTVTGRGGHGAEPHTTVDATLVASQIVVAWQSIVARTLNPQDAGVLTVGSFHSGGANNVISAQAVLTGTTRAFDMDVHHQIIARMGEMAEHICAAYGATCQLDAGIGTPVTTNSAAGAALMQTVAEAVVGPQQVTQIRPMMVGEDMSEFLDRAPGCFILLGGQDPDASPNGAHHNPAFDFDERLLPTGAALLAGAAVAYLGRRG